MVFYAKPRRKSAKTAKGRPRIFCGGFSGEGVLTPQPLPLGYGPESDVFKVMDLKVKVTVMFCVGGIPINGSPLTSIQFELKLFEYRSNTHNISNKRRYDQLKHSTHLM